ncbi:putative RNA-directed DNA polymerase from transposon BS [Varanus komodoensis]|nr:putative RNA-directed DNA polymerase from transposon BS [Varanus komodoensis]
MQKVPSSVPSLLPENLEGYLPLVCIVPKLWCPELESALQWKKHALAGDGAPLVKAACLIFSDIKMSGNVADSTEAQNEGSHIEPEVLEEENLKHSLAAAVGNERNGMDFSRQSGIRPGYGTESALVALYDDLCREKDRGSASLLVLLDLSAAFDTIDHGIFLYRLAGLGVGGTALQWFHSYLNGRFQKVMLGDYGSVPWQLCHGVPLGSILSPLLFNVYMKPLGEVIRRCGLRNHQYADDTQLYLSFSTSPGEAVAVLNRCLAEVMGWMRANKLKLNPDKTEVLLVGGSGFGEGELNLVLNGVALPLRDKVRSLRVFLNPELSLEAQVTAVVRSTFFQLRLIHQLRRYLENDCLIGLLKWRSFCHHHITSQYLPPEMPHCLLLPNGYHSGAQQARASDLILLLLPSATVWMRRRGGAMSSSAWQRGGALATAATARLWTTR